MNTKFYNITEEGNKEVMNNNDVIERLMEQGDDFAISISRQRNGMRIIEYSLLNKLYKATSIMFMNETNTINTKFDEHKIRVDIEPLYKYTIYVDDAKRLTMEHKIMYNKEAEEGEIYYYSFTGMLFNIAKDLMVILGYEAPKEEEKEEYYEG